MGYPAVSPVINYAVLFVVSVIAYLETKNIWLIAVTNVVAIIIIAIYNNYLGLGTVLLNLEIMIIVIIGIVALIRNKKEKEKSGKEKGEENGKEINAKKTGNLLYYGKLGVFLIPVLVAVLWITGIFPMVIVTSFLGCQSSLKNIGTALDMYKKDHNECYPDDLKSLTPDYLRSIPKCINGYAGDSPGLRFYEKKYGLFFGEYQYLVSTDKKVFTVYCKGKNHKEVGIPENHPLFDSISGLVSH